jgi:hypothetical protein
VLRAASALLLGAAFVAAGPAQADPATAEALFQEGRTLLEGGQLAAACDKFESSQASEPSAGTLLNLADCRARQGRTATAWAHFVAAERLSRLQGRSQQANEAARRRAELEPQLSTLTVRAVQPPPGLTVTVNGRALTAGSLGSRLPVDPGVLILEFSAPERAPAKVEVTLRPSGHHLIVSTPQLVAASTAHATERPTTPVLPAETRSGSRVLAWTVGSIGLAALAVGGTFGVMALSSNSEAKRLCGQRTRDCPPEAEARAEERDRQALISTVGVAAGVVGLGVSAVLLLTSGSDGEPSGGLGVTITPGNAYISGITRF